MFTLQSSKKQSTPHHATPAIEKDKITYNATSHFNKDLNEDLEEKSIIMDFSNPASVSQITRFQVPKSHISVTSSSMRGIPAHIVGDKGGSTYSGGVTSVFGEVGEKISTNMLESEMNTIINNQLYS